MYITKDDKKVVLPMVVDLFNQEGINIDITDIKSWNQPSMFMDDVIREARYFSAIGKKCIVYTNTVSFKNIVSNETKIKIYDILDILTLIKNHKKIILLNFINKN